MVTAAPGPGGTLLDAWAAAGPTGVVRGWPGLAEEVPLAPSGPHCGRFGAARGSPGGPGAARGCTRAREKCPWYRPRSAFLHGIEFRLIFYRIFIDLLVLGTPFSIEI